MNSKSKIIKSFEKLGFDILSETNNELSVFGTQPAEEYNTGKDHFVPKYRSVFFGTAKDGYYITSNIHGKMRNYRCRTEYDTEIGNIFGHGKTIDEALRSFSHNFINKIYNINWKDGVSCC